MQLALAVNASLLTLLKLHVFCTEPFRIPLAGKVDVCMFDKTGTITSDELVAVGVVGADEADGELVPMLKAPARVRFNSAVLHMGLFRHQFRSVLLCVGECGVSWLSLSDSGQR